MTERTIDLVYFDGCPNADQARANLASALERPGSRPSARDPSGAWREWDLSRGETPERYRRFGSPTVLVDGRDVTGGSDEEEDGSRALACRADGAPSVDVIRDALLRHG